MRHLQCICGWHLLLWSGQRYFGTLVKPRGVESDTLESIIAEIASPLLGIAEDEEESSDPFVCLEEDAEELEDNKTVPDDC